MPKRSEMQAKKNNSPRDLTRIATQRISWLFVLLVVWYGQRLWYVDALGKVALGTALLMLLSRTYARFLRDFWNGTISAFLAPVWDARWLDVFRRSGNPALPEPWWSLTARKYWQIRYFAHRFRGVLWLCWVLVLTTGIPLIFSIFSGKRDWMIALLLPYLSAATVGYFLIHLPRKLTIAKNTAQALSDVTGLPAVEFARVLEMMPEQGVLAVPPYAHPVKQASFWMWAGYFSVATAPFLLPIVHFPDSFHPNILVLFIGKVLAFLLLLFCWLITVIRMGLPLARFARPFQELAPCQELENVCIWTFAEDLKTAAG